MSKHLFGSLAVLFVFASLLPGHAWATGARSGPAVFVSTAGGKQILVVDGETGNTVKIYNGSGAFSPEDIVVGPDKKIYICDPTNNKIYRVRQDGSGFETIYDQASNSSLPAKPEGPSFNGSDLYFNTHFSDSESESSNGGVWMITGATGTAPFTPTQVFDSSAKGEGTAFNGSTLLAVEQSINEVWKFASPTLTKAFIKNALECGDTPCVLDNPVGIAVNSKGHIFVANRGSLKNVNEFDSSGAPVGTNPYATFPGDSPYFLAFDAFDRLFVITAADDFSGGKVWRKDPGSAPTLLTTLVASSPILSTEAVGLALAPNTFLEKTYTTSTTSNTFDFTTDQVTISFLDGVNATFELIVFRQEIPQALLSTQLANPPFSSNTHCAAYPSDPNTCVVDEVLGETESEVEASEPNPPVPADPPTSPSSFACNSPNCVHFLVSYGATSTLDPGLAHAPDTGNGSYSQDIVNLFALTPGDPFMGGDSGGISRISLQDKPLLNPNANFCGFRPPLFPGHVFEVGDTIPVKFEISKGLNCTGGFITNATMRLTVTKGNVPQPVECERGRNEGNFFRVAGHQYICNLDTDDYTPGTFTFTVWGNGTSPHSIDVKLKKDR